MNVTWWMIALVAGSAACGSKKPASQEQSDEPKTAATASAGESKPPAPKNPALCVDPLDLQIEPLDLEALDSEMPAVDAQAAFGDALRVAKSYGTAVALPGGDTVVPMWGCQGTACAGGLLRAGKGAGEAPMPLPGLETVASDATIEFASALADVNSDGTKELWLGYTIERQGTQASYVVMMAVPSLSTVWHGEIHTRKNAPEETGCEGTLHPADADCDGDGDIIVVQRCGPMKCLADHATECAADAISPRATVYLWNESTYTAL